MRFFIICTSLICLLLSTSGCPRNQEKVSHQDRTPIAGEQKITPTQDTITPTEEPAPEDDQIETSTSEDDQQRIVSTNSTVDGAQEHYLAFFSLLKTDIEAAEIELSKYVKTRFKAHPLGDKWVKLFVRLVRNEKGTFSDIQHVTQWHVQMLTDVKPEERTQAHTELLKGLQDALRRLESMGKLLESQGKDLETYEMPGRFDSP